ncbi:hypothetical protein QQF64_022352 [Cirrhinus molitorella]|uniref:Uncharacterized protein n=1 Tax=Cirrhinus molitorella TaxID=172907 RepID=A0ABR3L7Y1_9TELE
MSQGEETGKGQPEHSRCSPQKQTCTGRAAPYELHSGKITWIVLWFVKVFVNGRRKKEIMSLRSLTNTVQHEMELNAAEFKTEPLGIIDPSSSVNR